MEKTRTQERLGPGCMRQEQAPPQAEPKPPNYPPYTFSWPVSPQCGVCVATDCSHCSCVEQSSQQLNLPTSPYD